MNADCLTNNECKDLLNALFPQGFAGRDVEKAIVPESWKHSALKAAFHPSPEQRYKEFIQRSRNLHKLSGKGKDSEQTTSELTFEEFLAEYQDPPCEPRRELQELAGLCIWDVFSDSHEVIAPDGRIADLGSFRGTGGFIADYLNEREDNPIKYDYIDFYMGTKLISQRADLSPVYQMIFRRLKQMGGDWIYHFPQLYLIQLRKPKDRSDDPEQYDAGRAVADELEEREQEQKHEELKKDLAQKNREAAEEAARNEPPRIVSAYADAFGHLPKGWPPVYVVV